MKIRILKNSILPFLGVFLITVGNGKYISGQYGFSVEYMGLIILVLCILENFDIHRINVKKCIEFVMLTLLLCIGVFVQNTSWNTKKTLIITSMLLVLFSRFSGKIIVSNKKIKLVANAILCGCLVTIAIGMVTNTLGLTWNPDESLVGVMFLTGFSIKNYCGGIWLIVFMCYYIYYLRANTLRNRQNVFFLFIIFFMIIASGSKGAIVLCIIFILGTNSKKILKFKKEQKQLARVIIGLLLIACFIFIYNEVLPNIVTYAYRMRGIVALFDDFKSNPKHFIFGLSEVAYAHTGYDYTNNMRNYLGWQASVEMAFINIFIKNGAIGFIVYLTVYYRLYKSISRLRNIDQVIAYTIFIVMLLSGFVETYISTIHYVVGPTLYCIINGLVENSLFIEQKKQI